MNTIYKTPYIEAQIMNHYDSKLSEWPVPYKNLHIGTRFGSTHIIVSGAENNPPVFLFHAMGITSTMWRLNIKALTENHRVFAVDYIGDFGKSRLHNIKKYPRNGKEVSEWICEMMDSLQIVKADFIGASYGGWVTLNMALHQPNHVNKIVLLAPMGIAPVTMKVVMRLVSLVLFPSDQKKREMIDWTLGKNEKVRNEFYDQMWTAMNSRNKIAMPKELKDEDLQKIECPVLLFLGEKDGPLGSPEIPAQRAKENLSGAVIDILMDTGHLINVEQAEQINKKMIKYLDDSHLP